ncbi:uncharacterized protein LOC132704440 [Cylas formicarius]|uniref:uncharacterized protein LOC132704440 n=1 Tax=Cylas formicarius TaxID=197179 RepID=UPI002958391E|nr:uncharacterized protein LOC132704440 [Cylas formicarius]
MNCREYLRSAGLHPPVAVLPRMCTKNYTIPGTHVEKKGTIIEISVLGLQTDPDFFSDPDKFIPESFDDQNKSNIVDYTSTFWRRNQDMLGKVAAYIISTVASPNHHKMSALLVSAVVLSGLYLLLKFYSDYLHGYWKRRGVPQLDPEPLYGDSKQVVRNDKARQDVFLDFYSRFKRKNAKYGGVYLMYKPIFVPIDPSIVKRILTTDFEHFIAHSREFHHENILSANLFNMQGDPWRQLRRKLTPVFTSGKMKMMFEVIAEKAAGLVALVDKEVNKGGVDIKDILARFTTDIIGSCAFGIECNSMDHPDTEFRKYGDILFTPRTEIRNLFQVLAAALIDERSRGNHGAKLIENFFVRIVKDTIEYREKNNIFKKDFMHLMIQLKNRGYLSDDGKLLKTEDGMGADTLTEFEVAGQCVLFFLAGFETSATTMTYTLYELTQNPEVQVKIREEVDRVLRNHGGKLTYDAVMDMKYTERVIQEALRLHPPVAVLPRMCTKSYTIPGTDVEIEKGTSIEIPVLGLQTDPDYFPDPHKFIPERFDEENKSNIVDYTYLPFGEGPRMCLGLRFGMLQSRVGIATLLRRYSFSLNEKTRAPIGIQRGAFITAIDGGLWLNIAKINIYQLTYKADWVQRASLKFEATGSTMWLIAAAILSALTATLYYYSEHLHSYWKRKGVPQLNPEFFYGDARGLVRIEKSKAETFLAIYREFKKRKVIHGGVYQLYLPIYVPIAPSLIKNIMLRDFEYFSTRTPAITHQGIFRHNLFHLDGSKWRNLRRKLTPTFTSGKMKMMFDILLEKADVLREIVLSECQGEADVGETLRQFTTDVIISCAFGLESNTLRGRDNEFRNFGDVIFKPSQVKKNVLDIIKEYLPHQRAQNLKDLENFFLGLVKQTMDYREKNNVYRKDFLHLLIQLKNRGAISEDADLFRSENAGADTLTEFEIAAQCLIFFLAGFETSANTMTFALYELAQRPDVQDKIGDEVNRVLRKYDDKLSYDALMEMTYTENVLLETLRLHPPLTAIPRVCTKDYHVPDTEVVIEKGTQVEIPVWGVHLDPDYFPDPETFDPDRFDETNRSKIPDFTFLPFGEGPRICIGMRFGLMQSKIGLVSLLKDLRFALGKNTVLPIELLNNEFVMGVNSKLLFNVTKVA